MLSLDNVLPDLASEDTVPITVILCSVSGGVTVLVVALLQRDPLLSISCHVFKIEQNRRMAEIWNNALVLPT